MWRRKTYDVGSTARALPDIARFLLAPAAAVGLPGDVTAIAGRQDPTTVGAGLEIAARELSRRGERAAHEEGEDGKGGEELHLQYGLEENA